jgi:hypothetical protein
MDNIISALEHNDRICKNRPLVRYTGVLAVMQKPFPALTDLAMWLMDHETAPVIPDLFLNGSAPRLRLRLLNLLYHGIPFPVLPNLLLSATGLFRLRLWRIPHSLSAMTKLEGEWQTRVVSVNPEMECVASRVLAVFTDRVQIHPRMNRE